MAFKTNDNGTVTQALEGAVQANAVPVQEIVVDAELATGFRTADIANGLLMICNVSDGDLALFPLANATIGTAIVAGTDFSDTKDTASKINLYVDSGEIKIQNKLAADKNISLSVIAAGVDFQN